MNLPQPTHTTFKNLMNDIESGRIKIPQFQRDYVWNLEKCSNLLDSIVKCYPIGTFILWKTKERLRSIRNIGGINLAAPPEGDYVNYILDGQQRITSIYATLKGLIIQRADKEDDLANLYIDLVAEEDEQIIITDIEGKDVDKIIRVTDLLEGTFTDLAKKPSIYHSKMQDYKRRIETYSFSVIMVDDVPIDKAIEIFTRINIGGKPLTVFEIMVAKTFDLDNNFDLAEKYSELMSKLKPVNYDTIPDSTILQTVSVILKKDCRKKTILRLDKGEFIKIWPKAVDSIQYAVDYLRTYYRIPVSSLLPYSAIIVPFAYYFYKSNKKPTGDKTKYMRDFFWRTSLSERYSHALETKIGQDIEKIEDIINNRKPNYEYQVDYTPSYILENGWFSTGRSFIKAILCLYSYKEPKSFIDDSIVNISNDWLKKANSKNYHHFFPKRFLEKKGIAQKQINNIVNITIVDDYLNKREIRALAPSKYMAKFAKQNNNLNNTMKTHLINDICTFGIWDDDYERFQKRRALAISKEIKKKMIL